MNKAELIEAISESTGQSRAATGEFLNAFVATLSSTLKKGDSVTVVGFGSFSVRKRAARKGRNPQTGAEIKIKASRTPSFKAGKAFKDAV